MICELNLTKSASFKCNFLVFRKKKGVKSEDHPTGNASFFKAERFELCASELAGVDAVSGTDSEPLGVFPGKRKTQVGRNTEAEFSCWTCGTSGTIWSPWVCKLS